MTSCKPPCQPAADGGISYHGDDLSVLAEMTRYHDWIVEHFRPYLRGHMIEIGPGIGSISRRLLPYAASLDLVEPSANLVEILQQKFGGDEKVRVFSDTLERHLEVAPKVSADTIILVNVLEHVENDFAELHKLFEVVKPGGYVLLFVPALKILMSKLDYIHGHFRRYHRNELVGLVRRSGFEVAQSYYLDIIGVTPWFLLNTLARRTDFNPKMIRFYDRWLLPLTAWIESKVRIPFGKNLVVVARRPL